MVAQRLAMVELRATERARADRRQRHDRVAPAQELVGVSHEPGALDFFLNLITGAERGAVEAALSDVGGGMRGFGEDLEDEEVGGHENFQSGDTYS